MNKTQIKNALKECTFSPDDKFLAQIYDQVNEDYFITKAFEQLFLRRTRINRNEIIETIRLLLLAILKKDKVNGAKVPVKRRPRVKNTSSNSKETDTTEMVRP